MDRRAIGAGRARQRHRRATDSPTEERALHFPRTRCMRDPADRSSRKNTTHRFQKAPAFLFSKKIIPHLANDMTDESCAGCLTVLGGHGQAKAFPWGKPWDRQPVSGKLRRKLGVSPGFAAYRGPPPPKQLSTQLRRLCCEGRLVACGAWRSCLSTAIAGFRRHPNGPGLPAPSCRSPIPGRTRSASPSTNGHVRCRRD